MFETDQSWTSQRPGTIQSRFVSIPSHRWFAQSLCTINGTSAQHKTRRYHPTSDILRVQFHELASSVHAPLATSRPTVSSTAAKQDSTMIALTAHSPPASFRDQHHNIPSTQVLRMSLEARQSQKSRYSLKACTYL